MSRPSTRLSRPKASHEPRLIVSSTISTWLYAPVIRAQNSSSRWWWSSAYRSAYSAASRVRSSKASVVRQARTASGNSSSTFSPSRSVRQSRQNRHPLICAIRSRAASNSRSPSVVWAYTDSEKFAAAIPIPGTMSPHTYPIGSCPSGMSMITAVSFPVSRTPA